MFERNRAEFLGRLEPALSGWSATLAPFKGAPVVVYHAQWAYLLARFGLTQVGTVEERPGIPPAPGHVAKLIQLMKDEKVKVIIVELWSDYKLAERVAQEAGGQVVLLATGVGAVKGAETYLDAVDYNVKTLAKALK